MNLTMFMCLCLVPVTVLGPCFSVTRSTLSVLLPLPRPNNRPKLGIVHLLQSACPDVVFLFAPTAPTSTRLWRCPSHLRCHPRPPPITNHSERDALASTTAPGFGDVLTPSLPPSTAAATNHSSELLRLSATVILNIPSGGGG